MSNQLRWGIIGLGEIAREFATAMNKTRPLYAAASRDAQKTQKFGNEFNVTKTYTGYEDLLNDKNVDIVYIATVNSQHFKNIKACLNAGKHVLCEKSILGSSKEYAEVRRLAEKSGLLLGEAMPIFHMPLLHKVKTMVDSGVLGRLKFVEAELGSLKEDDPSNRFFNKDLGGGAMLDIGTYGLSFVMLFLDSQLATIGNTVTYHAGGADESWGIRMKDGKGVVGSVNVTFRAKLPKRAIVAGDKAYFEIYNYVRADTADLVYPDGKRETLKEGKTEDAILYEIQNAEKAVISGNYTGCRINTTAAVVDLMDYCLTHPDQQGTGKQSL
jgi:predicted dehydrogenase